MVSCKLIAIGDCHSHRFGGRFLWLQSTCWYFCAFHGYRSNLWAYGWDYSQSSLAVRIVSFQIIACLLIDMFVQGEPTLWHVRSLCSRCPLYHTGNLRVLGCSCRSEVITPIRISVPILRTFAAVS